MTLQKLLQQAAGKRRRIFFRADDVAVPSRSFSALAEVFVKQGVPLSPAVVPVWLTERRLAGLKATVGNAFSSWCWHQHGYRHMNHEATGKKYEFGPSRPAEDKRRDITRGRDRLQGLMGDDFSPVFTPPWNRVDEETLHILRDEGFRAISRSAGAKPPAVGILPDIPVQVDLHTRKEEDPAEAWTNLYAEFEQALEQDICGVMIHHQRMNKAAVDFLDLLLRVLKEKPDIELLRLDEMVS
jgi:hypothetical protein